MSNVLILHYINMLICFLKFIRDTSVFKCLIINCLRNIYYKTPNNKFIFRIKSWTSLI
mgnify:CR=1 FL=1